MTTYDQGVLDERQRIIDLLDQYEITELIGGGYMLTPPVIRPDKSWKGKQHITGSVAEYIKRGCRCDACRTQMREYTRERKRRNKQ